MRIVELPERWRTRAMVVHDVVNPEAWFSPKEIETVQSFRLEKRRQEWMLSRIAEKELRRRGGAGACVSYSHSGPYGAAAIAERPVGIDVEVLRLMAPATAHLFLSDEEEATAQQCRIRDALLHFWSAKEARWKQFRGTIPTLKRVRLDLVAVSEHGLQFAEVETVRVGEVVVALTLPTP